MGLLYSSNTCVADQMFHSYNFGAFLILGTRLCPGHRTMFNLLLPTISRLSSTRCLQCQLRLESLGANKHDITTHRVPITNNDIVKWGNSNVGFPQYKDDNKL